MPCGLTLRMSELRMRFAACVSSRKREMQSDNIRVIALTTNR